MWTANNSALFIAYADSRFKQRAFELQSVTQKKETILMLNKCNKYKRQVNTC